LGTEGVICFTKTELGEPKKKSISGHYKCRVEIKLAEQILLEKKFADQTLLEKRGNTVRLNAITRAYPQKNNLLKG
jgi:hypothetical protein